jgi:hypothetical protein
MVLVCFGTTSGHEPLSTSIPTPTVYSSLLPLQLSDLELLFQYACVHKSWGNCSCESAS